MGSPRLKSEVLLVSSLLLGEMLRQWVSQDECVSNVNNFQDNKAWFNFVEADAKISLNQLIDSWLNQASQSVQSSPDPSGIFRGRKNVRIFPRVDRVVLGIKPRNILKLRKQKALCSNASCAYHLSRNC